MRKKLSTQIEKRERERFWKLKKKKICDEKENDFLTVYCSEVQYIYICTQRSAMALSGIPEFTGLIHEMRREFRSLI